MTPVVWLPLALSVAYPLLSHLGATLHQPLLQWLALLAVVAVPISGALLRARASAWAGLLAAGAALYALTHAGGGQYALYLPPLLLPGALCATFGLSLRAGHTPLISAIANAARGPLTPALWRYTRRLTAFWSLFTGALVAIALLLTVAGPHWVWLWSWFTNFVSYALVGLVFVGEFMLRRRWFPDHPHPGFVDYLRIVAKGAPKADKGPAP